MSTSTPLAKEDIVPSYENISGKNVAGIDSEKRHYYINDEGVRSYSYDTTSGTREWKSDGDLAKALKADDAQIAAATKAKAEDDARKAKADDDAAKAAAAAATAAAAAATAAARINRTNSTVLKY